MAIRSWTLLAAPSVVPLACDRNSFIQAAEALMPLYTMLMDAPHMLMLRTLIVADSRSKGDDDGIPLD